MPRIAVCAPHYCRFPLMHPLRDALRRRYGQVTFNEDRRGYAGDELIDFLRGHDRTIVGLEKMTDGVFEALPELRVVSKIGVGLDTLDLDAMARRGIKLGWTPGVNRRAVAELALASMLSVLRCLPLARDEIRQGLWQRQIGGQLTEKTVGIIGCGNIGKEVVLLLQPFRCRILAHDIRDYPDFYRTHAVGPVALEELLAASDVVSLHLPLDASTRDMLTAERLALMKPGAVLVNTARGGLVDEAALKAMLMDGRLAGAAFDVFASEPPEDLELLNLPNFLPTPHIGASARESMLAMGQAAIDGLENARIPEPEEMV